ncbi:MAG: hypothetical protein AAFX92_04880 [Pseudomonadota bacterium]
MLACIVRAVQRIAAAAALLAVGLPAQADDPMPNLEGVWIKTAGQILYWTGEVNTFPQSYDVAQIEITGQDGAVLQAVQSTVAREGSATGRQGTQPITQGGQPMIGVVGWDGTSVVLSDVGDTTVHHCTLVDQNTLHCLVWEAGDHALAGRITLVRE